jgi:hypothetical protein
MKGLLVEVLISIAVVFTIILVVAAIPTPEKSPNITNAEKLCRDNLKLDVKSVSVFKNRIIIICEDGENE